MEIVPDNIIIEDLLKSVLEACLNIYSGKQIKFSRNIDDKCVVFADRDLTEIVLLNLVTNSIKYTPSGGSVIFNYKLLDSKVQIDVIDTGVGIEEEDGQKIFRIDKKLKTSDTAGIQGSGLGLIICQDIIRKSNGEIWLESKVGEGTTFSFTLPKGTIVSTPN